MRGFSLATVLCLLALCPWRTHAADPAADAALLVAHEWGTFTTLQDELGRDLSGINIDDEPVPGFVHNLSRFLLQPAFVTNRHWVRRMKGTPQRHPRVTMRLETPVIYFHLPEGTKKPVELDVGVRFRGGWLTEFYPDAKATAPGIRREFIFGELNEDTESSLRWSKLQVGTEGKFPKTNEPVWTTPRQVDCDAVTTPGGESEQYLFYRGVARRRSPVRVVTREDGRTLDLFGNFGEVTCGAETRIPALWLVDVRDDGTTAFRAIDGTAVTSDETKLLATVDSQFEESDYHEFHRDVLKKLMWTELCRDGLYGDEATAMLNTWSRAYFKSPGRRLFFVVPREWTDHYLPLEIPKAERIERVMIGRIELVTAAHRNLLAEIAASDKPDASWVSKIPSSKNREKFFAGRIHFGNLGVEIPEHYQRYLALGRFRNALIVDEERHRPTPALSAFIDGYGLRPYRWEKKKPEKGAATATAVR